MKKIFLILISIGFISSAIADNFQDKINLKTPLKLSDIADKGNTECDLCGCYMGLDPNYHKNLIGLRYHTFKFFTAVHTENNDIGTDHPGHPGVASTEYYNNVELFGRYYFTPKLRLLFSLPFSFNNIDNKRLNGIGDMKVLIQYQIYNSSITSKTKFWQRIFLGGGLKLPTGEYNKSIVFGEVEPHFQPGTGSFDLILTGSYLAQLMNIGLGISNDIVYTINSENKNDYRFANRFNVTSTLFYDIPAGNFILLPHAGIYYEYAKADKFKGVDAEGSGGNVLFGTGGLDIYYKEFSMDLTFQLPISENLLGEQPENKYRLYLGLGYSF